MRRRNKIVLYVALVTIASVGSFAVLQQLLTRDGGGCQATTATLGNTWLLYGESAPSGATQSSGLLMPPGCTATISGRVTYAGQYPGARNYSFNPGVAIFYKSNQSILPTSSIKTSASLSSVRVSPDLNVTMTVTLVSAKDSTGFYLVSPFGSICPGFRLAVGQPASSLKTADWDNPGFSCTPIYVSFTIEQIQGATVVPLQ